jgi:alkyl hydroperoxide reductase subunit AhpC
MKTSHVSCLLAAGVVLFAGAPARADVAPGQPAPDFTLQDSQGSPYTLSAQKGKYVVLEWFNPDCPFVKKHYETGNMQALQRTWRDRGIIWWSINSSAAGQQGNYAAAELEHRMRNGGSSAAAIVKDEDGTVGKLFGAKTTPHLFIIDPEGVVIYAGAIDDKPSVEKTDVKGATNYVSQALNEALAGKPVTVPSEPSYGCSVKYKRG